MAATIQFEHAQPEPVDKLSDDEASVPAAKTFLGIAYLAISGKSTASRIDHFMRNTEQAFEDLLRHY